MNTINGDHVNPESAAARLSRRRLLGSAAAAGAALAAPGIPGLSAGAVAARQDDGVTVVMVGEADLETLRVDTWGSLLAYQAYRALYEPLVHYQTKVGEDGQLYYDPDNLDFRSAESVEVADDGTTLRWKIRPNQTFENGRPIDAEAWAKTFHWHFDRKGVGFAQAQVNGTLRSKEDIFADGDVLVMKFEQANPWMINSFYILNQAVVDVDEIMSHATEEDPYGEKWCENNTVASGPFKLEKWVRGEQIVFTARPDYWAGKAPIDKLVMRIVPDASIRYQLLKQGEVDIASGITYKDLASLQDDPNIAFELWRTNDWREIVLNWSTKPLDDVNVRRAIASAVPYEEIMSQVFYGIGEAVKTPFGLLVDGADPSLWPYSYDLEKAKEYLSQSAYPDGVEIPFYVASTNVVEEPVAVLLKDSLAKIGITLNLQKMTGVQLSEALINKQPEAAQFSFYSWVPDAGYHILWNFLPDSFANFGSWTNAEAQALGQELVGMPHDEARVAKIAEFQKMFAEDVASLPLVSLPEVYPHKKNVTGFAYFPDSAIRWDLIKVE